jgi:hypothetical protein
MQLDRRLTAQQEQQILKVLAKNGLNPGSFVWEDTASQKISDCIISMLLHTESLNYFKFDYCYDQFLGESMMCVFSPHVTVACPDDWNEEIELITEWAKTILREKITGSVEKKGRDKKHGKIYKTA